ncbi:MAG TPA: hypothetical protein VFS08_14055 [Gemmatimonadaceae bacterium]|nr:hypothetical protein [Gemmatimonadaceae bacterium]
MPVRFRLRHGAVVALALASAALAVRPLAAQERESGPLQRASQLDREGKTTEARALIQSVIDTATDPAAKARAQRIMALSYAFDGDCANTLKYEQMVIDYWKTQEQAEPQNAFYQEGEMANEGARVCIDVGELDLAEQWYRKGYELGTREPQPATHPRSLWDYRLAHALGRVAARRGDAAEAQRQIAAARHALDSDSAMAAQQERFFPYLVGYVALYTDDLAKAQAELEKAVAMRGNERDPFMHILLAMTYEKQGRASEANAMYEKARELASRGHNPPAAFVHWYLRTQRGASPRG